MQTDPQAEEALATQLSEVLSALNSEILRASTNDMLHLLRCKEVSIPRMVALMFVERQGSASISAIGDHLNLTLGTASHIVEQLVGAGYVARTEDPRNRRLKQVTLTDAGRDFVARVRRTRVEELARKLATMPAPQLAATLEVMTDLTEFLKHDAVPVSKPSS